MNRELTNYIDRFISLILEKYSESVILLSISTRIFEQTHLFLFSRHNFYVVADANCNNYKK
jgi:hypothetical protein